jgi:hypothetical protein
VATVIFKPYFWIPSGSIKAVNLLNKWITTKGSSWSWLDAVQLLNVGLCIVHEGEVWQE